MPTNYRKPQDKRRRRSLIPPSDGSQNWHNRLDSTRFFASDQRMPLLFWSRAEADYVNTNIQNVDSRARLARKKNLFNKFSMKKSRTGGRSIPPTIAVEKNARTGSVTYGCINRTHQTKDNNQTKLTTTTTLCDFVPSDHADRHTTSVAQRLMTA